MTPRLSASAPIDTHLCYSECGHIIIDAVAALRNFPLERLWINPDCGLKTRGYAETEASLHNMVLARNEVLASLVTA